MFRRMPKNQKRKQKCTWLEPNVKTIEVKTKENGRGHKIKVRVKKWEKRKDRKRKAS